MSSFIGCEQRITIVEKHNERCLYPMLLKSYHHLHPMVGSENEFVYKSLQIMNADYSLDILEMASRTSEPSKEGS